MNLGFTPLDNSNLLASMAQLPGGQAVIEKMVADAVDKRLKELPAQATPAKADAQPNSMEAKGASMPTKLEQFMYGQPNDAQKAVLAMYLGPEDANWLLSQNRMILMAFLGSKAGREAVSLMLAEARTFIGNLPAPAALPPAA